MRGSSEWLKQILPTLIWVVTRLQYEISAAVSQTSFGGGEWWRLEMSALFLRVSLP